MKRVVLVNGIPASGKSTVARIISSAGNWPLLTLDTIKEGMFAHLGTGDRDYNRLLGRASYQVMFDLVADCPDGMTAVLDAWFGFQPEAVLASYLQKVRIASVVQVWCQAPPAVIGSRYERRVSQRSGGHLGLEYVPELIALAEVAKPLPDYPTHIVDTTRPLTADELMIWIDAQGPDSTG